MKFGQGSRRSSLIQSTLNKLKTHIAERKQVLIVPGTIKKKKIVIQFMTKNKLFMQMIHLSNQRLFDSTSISENI